MAFNNAVNATVTGMQFISTTGQWTAPTLTNHAPVIANSVNEIATTAAMTNGQFLIGSTGADPVPASITAGSGITLTPGAGSLTISATAAPTTWTVISASQALVANNGYFVASPGGAVVLTLPTTPTIGDTYRVTLDGATSWSIAQNSGQTVRYSSSVTTSGAGGSITSTAQGDTIVIVAQSTTRFNVIESVGNLTTV